ncbi:tellurite resistance TerB family protein [Alteromonas flava]|uniref:tellurite resistance TerB family protein n=1 Tax=Alteromonas flava TaxID=2048003 RepID=UPI000C28D004|nr:tellurite resistance TerB family protein [Alteromonas flava]
MRDLQKLVGGLSKSGAISGFLGGVAGGGLTSMVTSKKGRKAGKTALKVGALAAVGGLAWKAYQQYSSNPKQATAGQPSTTAHTYSKPQQQTLPQANSFNYAPARLHEEQFNEVVDEQNESGQLLLMRAMIAAAYADGHIDDAERNHIFEQVETLDLSVEEKATLFDELRKPMTLPALVAAVPDAQTGIEVYAASASAIDLGQPASAEYLDALARQLCIPNALVSNIHQQLQQV